MTCRGLPNYIVVFLLFIFCFLFWFFELELERLGLLNLELGDLLLLGGQRLLRLLICWRRRRRRSWREQRDRDLFHYFGDNDWAVFLLRGRGRGGFHPRTPRHKVGN